MVTKKARTEYMKKFRDPKWETFSKCYEDSLKYRLTRRVMEHSHKPWFWEGWDSCSDSSGWSTPRLTRNKVVPLSLPPPTSSEVKQKLLDLKTSPGPEPPSEDRDTEVGTGDPPDGDAAPPTDETVGENPVSEASGGLVQATPNTNGPSVDTTTDNGPADSTSSDGESMNPAPQRRHRRRTPRSEPRHQDSSHDNKPAVVKKPPRAKSQPPVSTKENRRPSSRLDWTERPMESHSSNAGLQTRRESGKWSSNLDRRRARSADLEKTRLSQLTVVDDRWMTEYMRCFSARLR